MKLVKRYQNSCSYIVVCLTLATFLRPVRLSSFQSAVVATSLPIPPVTVGTSVALLLEILCLLHSLLAGMNTHTWTHKRFDISKSRLNLWLVSFFDTEVSRPAAVLEEG